MSDEDFKYLNDMNIGNIAQSDNPFDVIDDSDEEEVVVIDIELIDDLGIDVNNISFDDDFEDHL